MPARVFPKYPDFGPDVLRSKEDEMFRLLQEKLTEEYMVFYSPLVQKFNHSNLALSERQVDFIIFHPEKGIICLEAKNGKPQMVDGQWKTSGGDLMKYGGPYRQSESAMHSLYNYINDIRPDIACSCKIMYAVWLFGYNNGGITIPLENDKQVTFFHDSDIKRKIDQIFTLNWQGRCSNTRLSSEQQRWIVKEVLAPTSRIDVCSIARMQRQDEETAFEEMKREQMRLFNYLEEQQIAVINGCAGSGKTVMAVEKALRNAAKNEKTLFLCYNRLLRDFLASHYENPMIDFFNIDLWMTQEFNGSIDTTLEHLMKFAEINHANKFPYKHIVVDEGQDFEGLGDDDQEDGSETKYGSILEWLKLIIECQNKEEEKSSFYIFYDKNQLVQAKGVSEVISDADCKITLYCNCRNTTKIAAFLGKVLVSGGLKDTQKQENSLLGEVPTMIVYDTPEKAKASLDKYLSDYIQKKNSDHKSSMQILTALSARQNGQQTLEKSSCLGAYLEQDESGKKGYFYKAPDGTKIPFSTCRKFKGLEADCVIVVDVNANALKKSSTLTREKSLLYVGSSRARVELCTMVNMSPSECVQLVEQEWGEHLSEKTAQKTLVKRWGSRFAD